MFMNGCRLFSLLLFFWLASVSGVSQAAAPIFGVPPSIVSSYVAACAQSGADYSPEYYPGDYYTGTKVVEGQYSVIVQIIRSSSGPTACRTLNKEMYCAAGGQPDTGLPLDKQCPDQPESCVSPLIKEGDKCVDPCAAKGGKTTGKVYLTLNGGDFASAQADLKPTYCVGGCSVNAAGGGFSANDIVYTKLGSGVRHYYLYADFAYSGSSCKVGANENSSKTNSTDGKPGFNSDGTNPPVCKPGEASGVVNGKPVCLKQQTTSGGVSFGITPESNPNNVTDDQGNVTATGTDAAPATGSFSKFCQNFPASPACSSGDGNAAGETGNGKSATGTTTDGSGSGNASNCPGCATESTLAAVKGLLDPAGVNPGGAVDGAGNADDAFKAVDDSLLALKSGNGPFSSLSLTFPPLFPSASECQKPSVNVLKQTMEIDTCYWIDLARQALGWVTYCLTVITLFRIATGGNKQGDK